jgi:hypothetical protein
MLRFSLEVWNRLLKKQNKNSATANHVVWP